MDGIAPRLLLPCRINPLLPATKNFSVADVDGEIIGFGQVRALRGGAMELCDVFVDEKNRYCGVGTRLVLHLLGRVRGHQLYLATPEGTSSFFSKLGFERIGNFDAPLELGLALTVRNAATKVLGSDKWMAMRYKASNESP